MNVKRAVLLAVGLLLALGASLLLWAVLETADMHRGTYVAADSPRNLDPAGYDAAKNLASYSKQARSGQAGLGVCEPASPSSYSSPNGLPTRMEKACYDTVDLADTLAQIGPAGNLACSDSQCMAQELKRAQKATQTWLDKYNDLAKTFDSKGIKPPCSTWILSQLGDVNQVEVMNQALLNLEPALRVGAQKILDAESENFLKAAKAWSSQTPAGTIARCPQD